MCIFNIIYAIYTCLSIDPVLITDPVFQRHTWFLSFLALQFGFILFSRWTPRFETDSESKRKFFHPKNRSFHGIRPQMKAIAHMSVSCRYKTCWPWDFLWNEVLRNVRNQMLDWLLQFSSELKQELARTSLASLSRGCHPVSNLWFWIGPGSKEPCLWHYGHALWLWHLSYIARLSSLEKAASLST